MVTALGRDIDKRMGEESGADGYITKPFTSETLVGEVEAALEESRSNAFCSALLLTHEQLRGRKILLEYDPVTPYETCIRDFCFEAKGQGEAMVVVTPKAGPVTRVLEGADDIELIPMRDDLVLYPLLEEYSEGPLSFVYDSISDYIFSRGFNAAYGYTKNLLERIDERRITGLFLLNPEAHDTREVSAIRSLFSNQITFSGIGLEIQRIV
jgi:CheY-like chemotaxis protein